MPEAKKIGCQPCRIRHLKCTSSPVFSNGSRRPSSGRSDGDQPGDQATPVCGRCRDASRECIKTYNYRFHKARFADNQKWFKTKKQLKYVDETKRTVDYYASDLEIPFENFFPETSSLENSPLPSPATNDLSGVVSGNHGVDSYPDTQSYSLQQPQSQGLSIAQIIDPPFPPPVPQDADNMNSYQLPAISELLTTSHPQAYGLVSAAPLSPHVLLPQTHNHGTRPIWPLTDPVEAMLLRHYVQHLAIWLDLCDPLRHFETVVPQRAGSSHILLYAIFALSARHLSKIGDFDPYASNRYHDECLKYLIPMLNDAATISDQSIFAATIILRVLEEMDVAAIGIDPGDHMLGIQTFVSAMDPSPMTGNLSEASFWVGLRQEIYSALIHHKTLRLNLEHTHIDRTTAPTDDFAWANRAVVHCADVLNLCFGPDSVAVKEWEALRLYNAAWKRERPHSFTPVFYRAADTPCTRGSGSQASTNSSPIPEIWHHHASHVIGIQHHLLAALLLSIFNPTLPRTGPSRRAAEKAMDADIKADLFELCGIGVGNSWTPPAMFTASMGIALCGDRIAGRREQEALMDILRRTEESHGRPTRTVREMMMEAWEWNER